MKKILLGIVTFYPLVYVIGFMIFMASAFFNMMKNFNEETFMMVFPTMFIIHLLTILISFGLLIFYIIHAMKNESIDKDTRIIWLIILFMGNMIAMPIYWYLHIWRSNKVNNNLD